MKSRRIFYATCMIRQTVLIELLQWQELADTIGATIRISRWAGLFLEFVYKWANYAEISRWSNQLIGRFYL